MHEDTMFETTAIIDIDEQIRKQDGTYFRDNYYR